MEEEEPAEGQVDRLGKLQVLAGLCDGQHLAVGRGRLRHLITCHRVAVHRVDPTVAAHDLGQRHRHVTAAGTHVDAGPPGPDAQAVEGGGQRPSVHVVPQAPQFHAARLPAASATGPAAAPPAEPIVHTRRSGSRVLPTRYPRVT